MSTVKVNTEAVRDASRTVIQSVQDLDSAMRAVGNSADAAASTPAAGACEAVSRAAMRTSHSLYEVMQELSKKLEKAAENYEDADKKSTVVASISDGGGSAL